MAEETPRKRARLLESSTSSVDSMLSTTRTCNISSHSRLETLVNQLELLRRLDADAHAAVKAELQEQIERLKGQTQSLTSSLNAATKALATVKQSTPTAGDAGGKASSSAVDKYDSVASTASIESLQREVKRLKQQLKEADDSKASVEAHYDSRIKELQIEFDTKIEELSSRLSSRANEAAVFSREVDDEKSLVSLRESLRQAERRERNALAELKRISAESHNLELMKEQLAAAEAKATRLADAAKNNAATQARITMLSEVLARWRKCADVAGGKQVSSRVDASEIVEATNETFATLVTDMSNDIEFVVAKLRSGETQIKSLSERVEHLQERLVQVSEARTQDQAQLRELSLRMRQNSENVANTDALHIRHKNECDGLRMKIATLQALVDSYEKERVAFPTKPTASAVKTEKIIEKLLSDANAYISETHELMKGMYTQGQVDVLHAQIKSLEQEVHVLRGQATAEGHAGIEQAKEELSAGVDTAAAAKLLAKGEDPSAATVGGFKAARVLHLTANPTAAALKERESRLHALNDALKEENAALRAQLMAAVKASQTQQAAAPTLEAEITSAGDLSTVAAPATHTAATDLSTLAASNVELETLRKRMKDMFKQRLTTFRDCVYRLTGYKVDLRYATNQQTVSEVILRSLYFDREEDYLQFQVAGESIDLLETPFMKRLDARLFTYLHTYKSIPAFLSAITLDLFDKQTFSSTLS